MASCTRGTGLSTFLYAKSMQEIMGHFLSDSPLFLCIPPRDAEFEATLVDYFGAANMLLMDNWPTPDVLDPVLAEHSITDVYMQKRGENDGLVSHLSGVRTCVHCVFIADEPHGTGEVCVDLAGLSCSLFDIIISVFVLVYAKVSDSVRSDHGTFSVPCMIGNAPLGLSH
jgi:hypothetical protein